jgi:hypothetical protein
LGAKARAEAIRAKKVTRKVFMVQLDQFVSRADLKVPVRNPKEQRTSTTS